MFTYMCVCKQLSALYLIERFWAECSGSLHSTLSREGYFTAKEKCCLLGCRIKREETSKWPKSAGELGALKEKKYVEWVKYRCCCSVSKSWTAVCQASLSFTISWSLFKLMFIELVIPPNHLILCHPLLPCVQSFSASGSFLMNWLFTSGGQSVGASASVFPMYLQGLHHLGLTTLISLPSEGLSRVFSSTTTRKHQIFSAQPSLSSNSHVHTWLLEKS